MDITITEYQVADRRPWFASSKRRGGISYMHSLAIGYISAIVDDINRTPDEKVLEVLGTLSDMNRVFSDESIPDGYLDIQRAPALTEAKEEIGHPDCIINVTKDESFLKPWYVERILRDGGGMK